MHRRSAYLSKLLHGELLARPDLGDIKGVKAKLRRISLLRIHNLNISSPLRVSSVLNLVPQFFLGVVRVLTTNAIGLLASELLGTTLGKEVVLDVDELSISIYPLEGVATESRLVCPAVGCTLMHPKVNHCVQFTC